LIITLTTCPETGACVTCAMDWVRHGCHAWLLQNDCVELQKAARTRIACPSEEISTGL
jgi:hypothetical protein